jgi:hypothetical protein
LVLGNLGLMLGNLSQRGFNPATRPTRNWALWLVGAAALGLLLLSLYQPWLAGLFRFGALSAPDLALAAALGLGSGLVVQGFKAWRQDAGQRPPPEPSR